jgi:hypothetical protein
MSIGATNGHAVGANLTHEKDNFINEARDVVLNLGTTDNQLVDFFRRFLSSNVVGEDTLQVLNTFMNMRNQRAMLLSNLEEKRHQAASSIINNMR